ncbi:MULTISPECIES: hypothetical protein [unclassified Siphonobacter]|uniref:hypothetical protein n=1 Tax=unclassified Siphonobacter TaxID=2635712 RepID=UPI0027831FD1|nr:MULTISPECIES: hypothetical protein [unclassified Siphonobacter]MDQ1085532.1 hypothetical protein [Siphonobacter sp. SORGH_AS_1065]MDR6197385.1 hypothetical protein [Siphonobacter sp. SORGH_AS_0500]
MENLASDYSHINGWGIDADPKNEPTYPMKKYTGDDYRRLNYQRSPQQPVKVEILHSNERPGVTAVFGTSSPPSGLSGVIRRYAFRFSESEYGHWLPLLFADRVNVVEGIIDDLKRGYVPNIFAEKGWNAAWKYNRKGLITKIAVGALITTATVAFLCRRGSKHEEE